MVDIISNMANVQKGIPACWQFGSIDRKVPILGIGSGTHEDLESFETNIKCVIELCKNCDVLIRDNNIEPRGFKVYQVLESIFLFKNNYYPPKKYLTFED